MSTEACEGCGESVPDALARTVRLSVDRSNIDSQRLCPTCFANWIAHYQNEMSGEPTSSPTAHSTGGSGGSTEPEPEPEPEEDTSTDIIVD